MYKTLSSQTKPFRSVLSLVRSPFLLHPLLTPYVPVCSYRSKPDLAIPLLSVSLPFSRRGWKDGAWYCEGWNKRMREREKIRRIGEKNISFFFFGCSRESKDGERWIERIEEKWISIEPRSFFSFVFKSLKI